MTNVFILKNLNIAIDNMVKMFYTCKKERFKMRLTKDLMFIKMKMRSQIKELETELNGKNDTIYTTEEEKKENSRSRFLIQQKIWMLEEYIHLINN